MGFVFFWVCLPACVDLWGQVVMAQAMGRGRRSKDWQPYEVVELGDAGSVRAAGLRWLKQKGATHSSPMPPTLGCVTSYMAGCTEHVSCAKQWLFRAMQPDVFAWRRQCSCQHSSTIQR